MASLPQLLRFCDYLELRLHTTSLLLLRRILRDYAAGNDHTLVAFMRLGATVISIMPFERTAARAREAAAHVLRAQTQHTEAHDDMPRVSSVAAADRRGPMKHTTPRACVFRFLWARVATKNILWLRELLDEFCTGDDTLLRAFVQRGDAAICVLPVDVQALRAGAEASTTAATQEVTTWVDAPMERTSSVSVRTTRGRKRTREQWSTSGAVDAIDGATDGRGNEHEANGVSGRSTAPVPLVPPSLAVDDVRQRVVAIMGQMEEKQPWKRVFKPDALSMPFSRVRYPKLVHVLLEFWTSHARAVWERKFWAPFSCSRTPALHNERRGRQRRAQSFFEHRVLPLVFEELGAAFFVKLDRRATRCSGWFYLDQVVDLFTLARRHGLTACRQYTESQAYKRFPAAPGDTRHFFTRVNGESSSMWSSAASLGSALAAIVAAKATSSGSQ
ncbi:unnamed protein product [Hyaloperonospora brassicae]|uniref:Uncharacterized protein n=1 Tax=Hyaloperonospora brassicae TaxID=162125 RepID=A0AAV0U703_HYABA|nr:unnamed protein product [Hyaloperonospora brassicae]